MSGASNRSMEPGSWRTSQGLRYFNSRRHFRGAEEQTERTAESSEVINNVGMVDLSLSYALTERFTVQLNGPLQAATRSMPIRDANSHVVDRDLFTANGLGDMSLMGRGWLIDPAPDQPYNLELGLGVKFPTGATNLTGTRRTVDKTTGALNPETQSVDQSIQPGDGGVGVVMQASGYWQTASPVTAYLDGIYLLNPMNTNGVLTYRARPSEAVMSIADQFLFRVGGGVAVPWVTGIGASLGLRLDGVPVRDLVGPSDGFRRPGISLMADPGVSYAWGASALSLNVPLALYRNRLQSVTDILDATHGDAAFSDWMLAVSFTHTFGQTPTDKPQPDEDMEKGVRGYTPAFTIK